MSFLVRQESFDSVQVDWRKLADRLPDNPVFATPDWMRAWWEICRGTEEALLLTLREAGEFIGMAPLMHSGGVVRFMADTDVCDYHDFLFPADRAAELLRALMEDLGPRPWRSLVLEGLREGCATLSLLPDIAAKGGLIVKVEKEEVSPRIPIAESWDAYLETLNKKDRHELRRKLRRLEGAGTVRHGAVGYERLEADMTEFLALLRKSREEKAAFMTPDRERFFHHLAKAMARAGHLKLFFLELDGVRIAGCFCMDYKDTYHLYNSGYDTQYAALSAGLLLKAFCLKEAIEQRKKCYDLLRGAEPYKYHLGAQDRWLYRLTISRSEGTRSEGDRR